jgi:hypothetical protein
LGSVDDGFGKWQSINSQDLEYIKQIK